MKPLTMHKELMMAVVEATRQAALAMNAIAQSATAPRQSTIVRDENGRPIGVISSIAAPPE